MTDPATRRPLSSRDTGWARASARWLADRGATPNGISATSVVFALLAGLCLAVVAHSEGATRIAVLIAGALSIQARLLCNLFDGMVAVEGGLASPTGPFWNEAPDRVADIAIPVGAGIGAGDASLGWAAASAALLVAYLRAFGGSLGQVPDYRGPMAKPHRMATVTAASTFAAVSGAWIDAQLLLVGALWMVIAGGVITAWRRSRRIRTTLAKGTDGPR